jgi:hypothetical protein
MNLLLSFKELFLSLRLTHLTGLAELRLYSPVREARAKRVLFGCISQPGIRQKDTVGKM